MSRRKYKNATERRIKSNLRRQLKRIKKNKNPLRIGKDKNNNPIYIRGKSAQKERTRLAKSNAQYQLSTLVDKTRPLKEDAYNINARNMNFISRKQYDTYIKWHSASAQKQILKDRANSVRLSFKTRAESIGVSNEVMERLSEYFKTHTNREVLQDLVENAEKNDLTFQEIFDSNQETTVQENYTQLGKMFMGLGLGNELDGISLDDVETPDFNFTQWTGYSIEQARSKEERRENGRV